MRKITRGSFSVILCAKDNVLLIWQEVDFVAHMSTGVTVFWLISFLIALDTTELNLHYITLFWYESVF